MFLAAFYVLYMNNLHILYSWKENRLVTGTAICNGAKCGRPNASARFLGRCHMHKGQSALQQHWARQFRRKAANRYGGLLSASGQIYGLQCNTAHLKINPSLSSSSPVVHNSQQWRSMPTTTCMHCICTSCVQRRRRRRRRRVLNHLTNGYFSGMA